MCLNLNDYQFKTSVSLCPLSHVQLVVTPMDCSPPGSSVHGIAQVKIFPRSGLPFPSPGGLPNPGTEPASPASPALAGEFFTAEPSWKPLKQVDIVIH